MKAAELSEKKRRKGKNKKRNQKRSQSQDLKTEGQGLTKVGASPLREVWPPKMKTEIRDTRKFCKFYDEHGHKTDECRGLKVEIERMIDAGELRKFIAHKTKSSVKGEKRSRDDKGKEKEEERLIKILGTIHMTNGGGHSSSTIRRKQRREVMNIRETHMPLVIFDVEDYEHVKAPHNDVLVVTTIIENWNTERIPINEGSTVNLMTNVAYKMLGRTAARLRRVPIPLSGLEGPSINPFGAMSLDNRPRKGNQQKAHVSF
ncbi:uncharacterized protein LOC126672337 [Mercurialis annua]|uniref:uncharacterized protein LOC126672337 n=1 Tax=Mercurialis annua TaxID=3986 RepID=UPI00215FBD1C|nr:uncharacterized protein LOC126672337 [Mercurialis annua]